MKVPVTTLGLYLLCIACGPSYVSAETSSMEHAATALIVSLGEDKQQTLKFDFLDDTRRDWTYLPWGHSGLTLKDMSADQQRAARKLINSALSPDGVETVEGILALEAELYRKSWFKPFRDPQRYYLAVFGNPGDGEAWGWRVGGHHLSINMTTVDGQLAGTPFFTGANPSRVTEGPHKGLRVLGREEDDARALFLSLDDTKQARALIMDEAPSDILSARDKELTLACCKGLAAADMTAEQQQALISLLHLMTSKLRPEVAATLDQGVASAGLDKLFFAWAGSSKPGEGHYYRIQGTTLLIEYDNTQNDASHIHLVLRDMRHDFGTDMLRQHYRSP